VEQNASGLHSSKIHAHSLARLKGSHKPPLMKLWLLPLPIANRAAPLGAAFARRALWRRYLRGSENTCCTIVSGAT
jgi:hypothetical protein